MSKKELYEAIFNVQQEAPFIDKSADNPFFKSKYADLPSIWKAIKDIMGKNNLFVTHIMNFDADGEYIVTKIIHASTGQEMISMSKITLSKVTAQEYGSYITYMRRYALSAMLGLITDEDDDGNKATESVKTPSKAPNPPKVAPFTGNEFTALLKDIKGANSADELKIQWDKFNAEKSRMTVDMIATLTKAKDAKKIELENREMDRTHE